MNGKLFPLSGLVCLIVMMVLWAPASSTNATTFAPAQPGGVVFSSLAPGANPDITISLRMLPPSANFSTQAGTRVIFGDRDVATAGDFAIPTGAYVGALQEVWTLGLNSAECNTQVQVTVNLVDAATPQTTTASIAPAGPPDHVLANLAEDDGDLDNDGFVEAPMFAGNGVADGADAYPTFVAEALDPDGGGPFAPIVPRARYFGVLAVANQVISVVQLVIMQPGDVSALPNMDWMTSPWGFPMLVFFDNALGPPSNYPPFNITDFCNVSSNLNLLGVAADNACTSAAPPAACTAVAGGFTVRLAVSAGCPGDGPPNECGPALGCPCARVTNPGGPTVLTWRQYVVSQRDWDTGAMPNAAAGDGHTNDIDQCANIVDPAVPFDTDGDGLWDSCDPAPLISNPDEDGDGWENRLDNCPPWVNPQPCRHHRRRRTSPSMTWMFGLG